MKKVLVAKDKVAYPNSAGALNGIILMGRYCNGRQYLFLMINVDVK